MYFMETVICLNCILGVLIILVSVNGAPIITRDIFGQYFDWPVDFGFKLSDGQPLFGLSKTWRGLIVAVIVAGIVGNLVGLSLLQGAIFGLLVMIGDLLSSFTKRRMKLAPSSRSRCLDTLPESLLPVLMMKTQLGLHFLDIILVITIFFLVEVYLSLFLYHLHIRKRPY